MYSPAPEFHRRTVELPVLLDQLEQQVPPREQIHDLVDRFRSIVDQAKVRLERHARSAVEFPQKCRAALECNQVVFLHPHIRGRARRVCLRHRQRNRRSRDFIQHGFAGRLGQPPQVRVDPGSGRRTRAAHLVVHARRVQFQQCGQINGPCADRVEDHALTSPVVAISRTPAFSSSGAVFGPSSQSSVGIIAKNRKITRPRCGCVEFSSGRKHPDRVHRRTRCGRARG